MSLYLINVEWPEILCQLSINIKTHCNATLVESNNSEIDKQIVVGFTCLEYDNIMTLENKPEIKIGDVFRFDKLGAYTITLSPLFISYFPAVYVREADGSMTCVRKKWTAKEFIQSSIL